MYDAYLKGLKRVMNLGSHCSRCGLYLEKNLKVCPYCKDLTDEEVIALLKEKNAPYQRKGVLVEFLIFLVIIFIFLYAAVKILK